MPGDVKLDEQNITLVVHVDDIVTVVTENSLKMKRERLKYIYELRMKYLDPDDIMHEKQSAWAAISVAPTTESRQILNT